MLTGNVVIYVCGLPWLHHSLARELGEDARVRRLSVRAGRLVKLYLAALALPGAWKLVERIKRRSRGGRSTANWSVISSVRGAEAEERRRAAARRARLAAAARRHEQVAAQQHALQVRRRDVVAERRAVEVAQLARS